ncbi:MAG: hypothetical protein Q9222_007569 [Ikaeria aurantiellina]
MALSADDVAKLEPSSFLTPTKMYQNGIETNQETWTGPVKIFSPPCDCLECGEQFRSIDEQATKIFCVYAGQLSNSEASALSCRFCTRLLEDLQSVLSGLRPHAEVIQKRWIKKSNTKKRAFIKHLRPEMHESQNAFLDIHMTKARDALSTRRYGDAFLLPYLTMETLCTDSSRMLRVLHHRTAHTPEAWVPFDNRQILAGWLAGTFEERFNAESIVMFGKAYGKWMPFDKKAVHSGDAYGTPRALLILEAQATLATFLRDSTISILSDIDQLTIEEISQHFIKSHQRDASRKQENPSWMQYGMTYYKEPFSSPPVFNLHTIDQLLEIVSDKQAEAHDHLWLLQTDPAYFHDFASYWNEYSVGNIAGSKMSKDEKLHALEGRVLQYSATQALDWNQLAEELQYVRQEYRAHHKKIRCGCPLPESYDRALGALQLLVINRLIHKCHHVGELAFASPAWRSMYKINPAFGRDNIGFRMKNGGPFKSREIYKCDHIRLCLVALGQRPESTGSMDIALGLKSLDLYLAQFSKTEASKIGSITYRYVTDTAAMDRILAALRTHRPAHSLEYTHSDSILNNRDSHAWRLWRVQDALLKQTQDPKQFHYGNALKDLSRYRMPTGKKTQQWLESADRARAALYDLWTRAQANFRQKYLKVGVSASDTEEVVRMLSYYDSVDHRARIAQERQEILTNIARSAGKKAVQSTSIQPYQSSIPHISMAEDLPARVSASASEVKLKPKSRAKTSLTVPESQGGLNTDRDPSPDPPTQMTAVFVPKKIESLETLRLLFPTAISDLQGAIHWDDFVKTMAELNFKGEHRGGSEWTFRSSGLEGAQIDDSNEGKKSIVIHQPHRENRMGTLKLQWIGKRLWRRFGWSKESFEGL